MNANDANNFREVIGKEIESFKDNGIFELIPLKSKPEHKSLTLFMQNIMQ